jgi:aminoglycoside 6'-N-acetyltransferase
MAYSRYEFRPMTVDDLPLVLQWLKMPHVMQWWGDTHKQFDLISADLDHEAIAQFIVAVDGRPAGYLQCYDPSAWPGHGFGEHPAGARGIDQFIGEADMVDRGHGSAFVRTFIERLLATGTPRVLTDPDPNNARAIRAYEKAGFQPRTVVTTPNGPALLMVRDA